MIFKKNNNVLLEDLARLVETLTRLLRYPMSKTGCGMKKYLKFYQLSFNISELNFLKYETEHDDRSDY